MSLNQIAPIIERHGRRTSAILEMLLDMQSQEGYLPREHLQTLAREIGLPLSHLYRVATFYNALSLQPRGRYLINVCLGTACHVRGGLKILERLEKDLGISKGEVTADRKYSLETVNCVGCCALAPVVVVDGETLGRVVAKEISSWLKDFER